MAEFCPHGREMNTDQTAIFVFAGPVYTCACCHAHWGGYEGDPNITRYCGTCSGPKISVSRYVNTLNPPPERMEEMKRAREQRKKLGAPYEPQPPATCAEQRFTMLPYISVGSDMVRLDVDPPEPWWKRLWRYVWDS